MTSTLLKTLVYRAGAGVVAFTVILIMTNSLPEATRLTVVLSVVATTWYFVFEKLWARLSG